MAAVGVVLRPFRRPGVWVGLWVLMIVGVIVVCLGPAPQFPELPDNSDKVEHFLTYVFLAFGAVQLFATRRALGWAGGGLVLLGIGIEIAQGLFTVDRSADPFDAWANACGVVVGLLLVRTRGREWVLGLDRKMFGKAR